MKVSKIFSFTTNEKKNTFYGVILCVTLRPMQKAIWVIIKFVKRYNLKIQLYVPTSKRLVENVFVWLWYLFGGCLELACHLIFSMIIKPHQKQLCFLFSSFWAKLRFSPDKNDLMIAYGVQLPVVIQCWFLYQHYWYLQTVYRWY